MSDKLNKSNKIIIIKQADTILSEIIIGLSLLNDLKSIIMKKSLLTLAFALGALSLLNAQFTEVGGGVDFTSGYRFDKINLDENKSGNIAYSLLAIYKITVPVQVSPSVTLLFHNGPTEDGTGKAAVTTMMIDLNGHYIFNSLKRFQFYGIGGLDFLFAWKTDKWTGSPTEKEKINSLGLNAGVGSTMNLTDQLDLFLEAKFIVSKYLQFMANAGILLNIDWLKKHENNPKD